MFDSGRAFKAHNPMGDKMFFRFMSILAFAMACIAFVAALGGFGLLPEVQGFRWPSELGAPWAALGMTAIFCVLAGWQWYLGGVGKPETPFGRYAKVALTGRTIQIVGYAIILFSIPFLPLLGNWILGK